MRTSAALRHRCDFLLSPVFLLSLAALLFNDLYLKPYHPGVVSGLLSDFAGIVFFPIFLVAVAEFILFFTPDRRLATPSWFFISTVCIAVLFVVMKFTEWGEAIYISAVEPVVALTGNWLSLGTTGLVADPLDLLALLLIPVPYMVGRMWRQKNDAANPIR